METALAVPFADVAAATLRYSTTCEPIDGLAEIRLPVLGGAGELHLILLGASHQAIVTAHGAALGEVVACGVATTIPWLPPTALQATDNLSSRFHAEVERPADVAATAAALRARFGDDPNALIGEFPGSPDALTVLALTADDPAGVDWQTWHLYPQTSEVVHTHTSLTVREPHMHETVR